MKTETKDQLIEKLCEIVIHVGLAETKQPTINYVIKKLKEAKCPVCDSLANELQSLESQIEAKPKREVSELEYCVQMFFKTHRLTKKWDEFRDTWFEEKHPEHLPDISEISELASKKAGKIKSEANPGNCTCEGVDMTDIRLDKDRRYYHVLCGKLIPVSGNADTLPTDIDDLKQYVTNLLYAAYSDGNNNVKSPQFDKWVIEEWTNIEQYFTYQLAPAKEVTDREIDIIEPTEKEIISSYSVLAYHNELSEDDIKTAIRIYIDGKIPVKSDEK